MNTDIVYTTEKISFEGQCAVSRIKGFFQKIVKALTFDAEAIFKSKEWPYL
jgi:hypothetical protein